MPQFNRRGFLKVAGAAGVTPLLPAMPARAITAPAGASVAKALWAGIYAKSGSVPKFLEVARGMGLSNTAIQGVAARSVGVSMAVSATTPSMVRGAGKSSIPSPSPARSKQAEIAKRMTSRIERVLAHDPDDISELGAQEPEAAPSDKVPD